MTIADRKTAPGAPTPPSRQYRHRQQGFRISGWFAQGFRRLRWLGVLAVLVAAASPATATTVAPVDENSCRGIQAKIPVPKENVDPSSRTNSSWNSMRISRRRF